MINPTITAWLRATNPLRASQTREEAVRAARIAAVGAGLMAVLSLVSIPFLLSTLRGTLAVVQDQMGGAMEPSAASAEEAAAVAAFTDSLFDAMPVVIAVFTGFMALVVAGLAVLQWRKPNPIIPGVLLAFCVYGLFSNLAAQTNPMVREIPISAWQRAYAIVVQLVYIALFTAALRGGLRLGALKAQGALPAAER